MSSECNGFRLLLGSEVWVGVGVGMRDGPKQRLGGELVCFWNNVLFMIVFFVCVLGDLIFTENYSSYHPYRKLLIISPGLYNFVRCFRRAYKPYKVTYSCTKKVLQTQAALQC